MQKLLTATLIKQNSVMIAAGLVQTSLKGRKGTDSLNDRNPPQVTILQKEGMGVNLTAERETRPDPFPMSDGAADKCYLIYLP